MKYITTCLLILLLAGCCTKQPVPLPIDIAPELMEPPKQLRTIRAVA